MASALRAKSRDFGSMLEWSGMVFDGYGAQQSSWASGGDLKFATLPTAH
jgi:hypothetical protein